MSTRDVSSAPPEAAAPLEPEDWQTGPAAWGARPLRTSKIDAGDLFLVEAVCVAALVAVALAFFERPATPVIVLCIALALLGLQAVWWRRRGRRGIDELERRVLTQDVSGLKARFLEDLGGEAVDQLTRGTRFVIGQNRAAEVCLYAYGREYPLSVTELYRVRAASRPVGSGDRSGHVRA
jgi:hypothetical protein